MHVIALIDDATVIRRILEHLRRWAPRKPRRNQRAPPADKKGIDGPKPPVQEWTYIPSQTSPELLNEDNASDQPGRGKGLALLRRLELIAQQFTAKLAPLAPSTGAQGSEVNIRCIARNFRPGSSTGLRRPGKPFRLCGRIDSPIPGTHAISIDDALHTTLHTPGRPAALIGESINAL